MSKVAETFYGALFTILWKQYRKLERLKVPVEKEGGNTICFVLLFYFHFIFKPDYYGIIRLLNKKII